MVSILDTVQSFPIIGKFKCSRLIREATGSVSKIYRTTLIAKIPKTYLANVKFFFYALFVKNLRFNELQVKALVMQYAFRKKKVLQLPTKEENIRMTQKSINGFGFYSFFP